jgi:hypothetical protein
MATARMSKTETARRSAAQPAPETEESRDRHLRVVPDARRRGLRVRITPRTGVLLTVSLFGALFGVAVSHAMLIESQMDLEQLDGRAASEQARYERLRRDVAELEAPDRIVSEAQDRLGMVPAEDVQWLTPDQPAPAGGGEEEDGADTPATSWSDVKPYMEPAP